eukprot:363525-Chlamydomonas_euryale.AAC.11
MSSACSGSREREDCVRVCLQGRGAGMCVRWERSRNVCVCVCLSGGAGMCVYLLATGRETGKGGGAGRAGKRRLALHWMGAAWVDRMMDGLLGRPWGHNPLAADTTSHPASKARRERWSGKRVEGGRAERDGRRVERGRFCAAVEGDSTQAGIRERRYHRGAAICLASCDQWCEAGRHTRSPRQQRQGRGGRGCGRYAR